MLRQKLLYVVLTLLATGAAVCHPLAAQDQAPDPPTLDELEHLVGVWKATIDVDGQQRTEYLMFRKRDDLNALAQVSFTVHPENKQIEQAVFGFIGIPGRNRQIHISNLLKAHEFCCNPLHHLIGAGKNRHYPYIP